MASETSAIALRSEEIRKEMPVATASCGGVANLSHDLFFILLYFIKKKFVCSEIGFIMGLSLKLNYYTIMCIIFIIITILTFIIMAYDQLIFYYGNYCAVDHTVAIYSTVKP